MSNLVVAIVGALVLVYIVVESVIAVRRVFRPAALVEDVPACGSCGYDTRGLAKPRCPECGADRRVVGEAGGKAARRSVRWRRLDFLSGVIGWTVLGGAAVLLGSGLVPEERMIVYLVGCGVLWLTGLVMLARAAGRRSRA